MSVPLPALIFLCTIILLLIALAILYVFLKKKGPQCCGMQGATTEEEVALIPDEASKEGELNPVATDGSGGVGDTPAVDAPEITSGEPPALETVDGAVTFEEEIPEAPQPEPSLISIPQESEAAEPVAFIESEEAEPISIAGKVLVQYTYMPAANKINLTLIRISDTPSVERGGSDMVQAHLCVLPMRKQRFRTKAVPVSKGVFNETFQFIHITKDLVETCAIRLRIYATQRFSKRLIGEVRMPLAKIDLTSPLADEQVWKNLSPKGLVAYCANIDEEDDADDDDW